MILHIHLFITLQDNSTNMGDLITMLELLQKLENGKLIPSDQIEKVAKILKNTLEKSLSPGVYSTLDNLLNQVDADSTNHLYIDII